MALKTKASIAANRAANNARITAANTRAGATVAQQQKADAGALASMNAIREKQGLAPQTAVGEQAPGRTAGALSIDQTTNEVRDASGNVVAKGTSLQDALAKQTQLSSGAAPTVAGRPDLFAVAPGANQEVKPFFDQSTKTTVTPKTATPEQMAAQKAGTLESFNKAQGLTYLDPKTFKELQANLNEADLIRGPNGQIWLKQGLTPDQVRARAATSVTGTSSGVTGDVSASDFTVDVPDVISTDTITEMMKEPVTETDFNTMLANIQVKQNELLKLMVPGADEQATKAQINDIKAQVEKTLTELSMGLNNVEDQPIAMQFITGQQASIQRNADAKLQNLARIEKNLLEELGLEQEARQVQASVAQTQLGYLQTNLDTAFKVEQMVQQNEDRVFARAQALSTSAQNKLTTILDSMQGIDENDMTTDQKKQLQDMADAAGIPYSLITSGLSNVKQQLLLKNSSMGGLSSSERTYLNQIQDNARQDPNIKNFADVRASYETARKAAESGGGAGDIVLMRMLAKITDPTTGVREEEFKTFEGAQGTLATFGINLTEKMWSGGRLTDSGRAALMQQATDIYSQRKAAYDSSVRFFDDQATAAGLPAGMVTPYYVAPEPVAGGLPDMSKYSVNQTIANALTNKVKTDASGNPLSANDIDFLSRYATKLYSEGKSDADVLKNVNMILRGENPPDFNNVGGDTNSAVDISSSVRGFRGRVLGDIQPATTISKVDLGGKTVSVNSAIADRLAMADRDYYAATGKHIPVSESYRDAARQRELFKKLSSRGARVAPQGYSFHELGMAVDVGDSWKDVKPYLNKYGFINGLANDMGHFSVGELS